MAAFGGIDVVLANAGVGNSGTVAISPPEVLLRTIEINVNGVVRTVSAALPHVTQRRGYVMIVSSTAAFTMAPGLAAYAASKAAVEQFANCLRLEVAHKGVKVGSVHPGWIDTDLVRDQRKDLKSFDEAFDKFPWPMNATTSVEDCADAIVDGMERRRRRVYVPKAIALVQALRTLTTGTVGYFAMKREVAKMVPQHGGRGAGARPLLRHVERGDAGRGAGRGAGQADRLMATLTTRPAAPGHRARLTEGLATAIAEKGYAAVTIADVVRVARVSKRTFYEHFADKEACFLALYAETSEELLELIGNAVATARGSWEERIGAAARAYFERVAAEPEVIRAGLLEIQAAGPRARALRREVQRRYAEQLRTFSLAAEAEEPGIRGLTPALATAVVGGLDELMLEAAEAGHADRMGELADAATELIRAVLAR